MADRLLIEGDGCGSRVALVHDRRLVEIRIDRNDQRRLAGNVYRGRVVRLAPGMRGAFVDIGLDRPGFLDRRPNGDDGGADATAPHPPPLHPGQTVLAQVTRDADGDKGVRLSTRIALASGLLVLVPDTHRVAISRRIGDGDERDRLLAAAEEARSHAGLECGCVVRTQAQGAGAADLHAHLAHLDRLWRDIRDCRDPAPAIVFEELPEPLKALRDLATPGIEAVVAGDPATVAGLERDIAQRLPAQQIRLTHHGGATPLFEAHGVEEQIRLALEPRVPLPGGGSLVIEQTEALTAVDVNVMPAAGESRERAALRANLEAAAELPRQLRLRNIGGIVVADLIGMESQPSRQRVLDALRAAVADDPAPVRVSGISPLGLVELARRRSGPSLASQLTETCAVCHGLGRHIAGKVGAGPAARRS